MSKKCGLEVSKSRRSKSRRDRDQKLNRDHRDFETNWKVYLKPNIVSPLFSTGWGLEYNWNEKAKKGMQHFFQDVEIHLCNVQGLNYKT